MINPWIEAMRLRTLPVAIASVTTGVAISRLFTPINWLPAILCLIFALLAQIASNFANEYFDYKAGVDKPGREGPRRGVTEGDISPRAMLIATIATLGAACLIGCSLIYWGGWILLPAGILIAIGALAYSAGPYPLSRHAMGELAVIVFFGIIPVNMIYYILTGCFAWPAFWGGTGAGLMASTILMVNNYRDREDDASVGKKTLATIIPSRVYPMLYWWGAAGGCLLFFPILESAGGGVKYCIFAPYITIASLITMALSKLEGRKLNPLLGMTACNLLLFSILLFIVL